MGESGTGGCEGREGPGAQKDDDGLRHGIFRARRWLRRGDTPSTGGRTVADTIDGGECPRIWDSCRLDNNGLERSACFLKKSASNY